jgi:hypothetical protein
MIAPNLVDLWIQKMQVTIRKETWHLILDLGSGVSILSKDLYNMLPIKTMGKCNIDVLIVDDLQNIH